MTDSEQETSTVSNKKTQLSWSARIFLSLFSASGIGYVLGILMTMDVTTVDGADGYAALVYVPTMIFFVFLALIFITNKPIHIILAVISAIILLVSMSNF